VAAEQEPHERTVVERRDPLLGEVFDRRFRVDARIAAGGFGAIYRATHVNSGHQFALKVLHANLTSDPRVVARFRREGAALTRLRDRHTITAYELGEAQDGTLYIVMELLHGESLYERFRARGALPWRRVIAIARAVCSSLAEAHALGIIHRDLKPTNIHLEPRDDGEESVKVLDFGIAKILQDSDIDSSDLTQAGQMIGTIDYMSPEQMVGGTCTPASDLYTLGVVMYEMIAGRKPFDDATSATAALAAVLTSTPDRLALHATVPLEVDQLVMKCLDRSHTGRYQSAVELAAVLDQLLAAGNAAGTGVAPSNADLVGRAATVTQPAGPPPMPSVTTPGMPIAVPVTPSVTLPTVRLPNVPVAVPVRPAPAVPDDSASDATPIDLSAVPPLSDLAPLDSASDATPIELPAMRAALRAMTPDFPPPAASPPAAVEHRVAPGLTRQVAGDDRASPLPARLPVRSPGSKPTELNLDTTLVGHQPAGVTAAAAAATAAAAGATSAAVTAAAASATSAAVTAPPTGATPLPTGAATPPTGAAAAAVTAPAIRARPGGTPHVSAPVGAGRSLREAYPMIHRPAPSPMQPPSGFEDRPISAVAVVPYREARAAHHAARRTATLRWLAFGVALVLAAVLGIVIASRL